MGEYATGYIIARNEKFPSHLIRVQNSNYVEESCKVGGFSRDILNRHIE